MHRNRLAQYVIGLVFCLFISAPLLAKAEAVTAPGEPAVQQMIDRFAPAEPTENTVIPVVAFISVFGGPASVLIVLILQHYRAQMRLADYRREAIGKLIEAGRDVPENLLFFQELNAQQPPHKNLQRGLVNLGFGLGLVVFLWAMHSLAAGTFGLIFIGIGAAQLIAWSVLRADKA